MNGAWPSAHPLCCNSNVQALIQIRSELLSPSTQHAALEILGCDDERVTLTHWMTNDSKNKKIVDDTEHGPSSRNWILGMCLFKFSVVIASAASTIHTLHIIKIHYFNCVNNGGPALYTVYTVYTVRTRSIEWFWVGTRNRFCLFSIVCRHLHSSRNMTNTYWLFPRFDVPSSQLMIFFMMTRDMVAAKRKSRLYCNEMRQQVKRGTQTDTELYMPLLCTNKCDMSRAINVRKMSRIALFVCFASFSPLVCPHIRPSSHTTPCRLVHAHEMFRMRHPRNVVNRKWAHALSWSMHIYRNETFARQRRQYVEISRSQSVQHQTLYILSGEAPQPLVSDQRKCYLKFSRVHKTSL